MKIFNTILNCESTCYVLLLEISKNCLRNGCRQLISLPIRLFWGEQQPVATFVAAGCIFFGNGREQRLVMDNVEVVAFGPVALLIRFGQEASRQSLARCRGLLRCLEENPLEGLHEVTPAYCSLLLEFGNSKQISGQLGKLDELLKSAQAQPLVLHEISGAR